MKENQDYLAAELEPIWPHIGTINHGDPCGQQYYAVS